MKNNTNNTTGPNINKDMINKAKSQIENMVIIYI